MARIIDIRMDNLVNGIKKGVPVTFNFTLNSDGAPPAPGSRLQFRPVPGVTLLHASIPASGAQMTYADFWRFSTITINANQTTGWNARRTVTLQSEKDLTPGQTTNLCGIVYYQPNHMQDLYCPVFGVDLEEQAIETRQVFKGAWQDEVTKGWICSYDVVLKASRQSFTRWKFSSAGLPQGSRIVGTSWLDVSHDATEGVMELVAPAGDKYLLEPGRELVVSVQLLYPATAPALQSLPNLSAYSL